MDCSCKQHHTSLCIDGLKALAKAPGSPKHQTYFLPKQLLIIVTQKVTVNSLQPLSAKGINVQTKPLAVSKINCSTQSPGVRCTPYALHGNACLHVSRAAVKSWEPEASQFDHRNATFISYCDATGLKALKISTGRSREGFSPISPALHGSLWFILSSNRCRFKKNTKKAVPKEHVIPERTHTQIAGSHLCHKDFSRDAAARKGGKSRAVKANIPISALRKVCPD